MTHKEGFIATSKFEHVDQVPFMVTTV